MNASKLKENIYSVLVVSSSEKFAQNIMTLLPTSLYSPIDVTISADATRRELVNKTYDIILVNAPLTDDYGVRLAIDLAEDTTSGVIMFVKNDMYDEVSSRLMNHGVMILPKPISSVIVTQSLHILCASRVKLRTLEHQNATLEDKMEEIRLVNRAKWILIDQLHMSENEAHRYIEKNAMDKGMTRREVATQIIKMYN